MLSQDGLSKVVGVASQLIYEKWLKLNETCRTQLTWLAKELVHNSVARAESVCHQLIRQISGGDLSPRNIWLTETVLDILTENRPWLDKCPLFLPITLYTYLRVIVDHGSPQLVNLRQREVEFCVSLMREKWLECQQIGRDLVRLLQGVARIPEFNVLWNDILNNPSSLNPQFTGVKQLFQMKTSRSYFVSRLTPDMETKLIFLTSSVRFGNHKRYQDWFQRQYLQTPESQSLRCDLIRYICAVIHPSNEVLCSEIIPRWAVIGWLLTTCTSNVAASNAKLALFYDWLFFDAEKDNIMNIEPCILVMYHSMRPHPAITATLLDFMCRIMSNFHPPLTSLVRQGIFASLQTILEKRVLQSLSPLFDNQKLDRELYTMLRENFAEFCSTESSIKDETTLPSNKDVLMVEPGNHIALENNNISDVAEFSDEDDAPLGKLLVKKETVVTTFKTVQNFRPINIQSQLDQLDSELRNYVVELRDETDKETQCEIMDRLIQLIVRDEFDQEDARTLATCLCKILSAYFENSLLPQELDDETIEDSIGTPMFVIFRNVCQTPEEDQSRQTMMLLLEEMYKLQPNIGYHFLYFLKVSKVQNDEKMLSYKDFCKNMEQQTIEFYLMTDLRLCQEEDLRLFVFLVPDIYSQFPQIAVGNVDLIHLIVSCIDGNQLQDLICEILQGHLVMFGSKESFLSVLNASLQWETIEQYFLWQLISVHTIPVEHIMPILPKLDFTVHAEALSSIMILLKQDCPSAELLRPLLCRECKKNDLFTVSLLKYWAQEYEDRLADLLHTQLTKSNGTPNKKRHRNQTIATSKIKDQPTTEQILAHLDHMRLTCRNISFLTNEMIQQGLQFVQTSCSEALKAKYGDLLALVEDFEEMKSTRVLRQVPSRRANQAATKSASSSKTSKKTNAEDTESSSECSDDEDQVPKSKKMKRFTVDD